jgi:hypothetical protein
MRQRTRVAAGTTLVAVAIGLTSLLSAVTATAAPAHLSPVVGHSYVDDNTAGANTIAAFDRHADGSLTPTAGSPFAIGGAGLGSGLGSQGAIQASPDGRFLLAVDAGSNQISVLRLSSHGAPDLVGKPVSSGGVRPVSIAISRTGLVYVANTGTGGSNYRGFWLSPFGQLIPLPGAVVPVPDGSGVGDILFNATGDRLAATRVNTQLIDSFTVSPFGKLTPAPGSPFAAQSLGPFGSEFRPTDPSQLFVSNAHAGTGAGTVSAFHDGANGVLTSIGASPYPDEQTAPCWVEISHDGRYLFAVNTAAATISSFRINQNGSLVLLGSTPFRDGSGATDARLSPDGRTLEVTGGSGHVLSSFAVRGGDLTEIPSSPVALPADSAPSGLVVN